MDSDKNTKTIKEDESKEVDKPVSDVPTVDKNAELEIEKITKSSSVPTVDKNASLKVEETQQPEEEVPQEKSGKNLFLIGGVILGVIILTTVGFFIFFAGESIDEKTVTPQTESSPTPTEIPKKTLNRLEWNLEVLNGSGVVGVAKKVADKLKDRGYPVVKTGNADKNDYETSQIFIKKELLDKIDLVITDLKGIVQIATVAGELKDSTASARIIIGQD